jgi:3',5'-nucleoside bisphosphate phosphatase
MKYADLHVHTHYSDSTFSPEEVVACAKDKGLSAIAICDHDSVDGIDPCTEIGKELDVEIIPGVELTVEKEDAEIHILGYFIDYKLGWLRKKLKCTQGHRVDRIYRIVEKLGNEGIKIGASDVFKLAGKGSVGRLHVAQALIKSGKVKTYREVFDKYIGFLKPCYVSNVRFTPQEAIGMVLEAGGVPVVAHPHTMGKHDYIPELVGCGLRGIEVYHTDHKTSAVKRYEEIAKGYGLLVTGGSDCHGMGKGRILLGGVRVPYTFVEKLKSESEKIRRESH